MVPQPSTKMSGSLCTANVFQRQNDPFNDVQDCREIDHDLLKFVGRFSAVRSEPPDEPLKPFLQRRFSVLNLGQLLVWRKRKNPLEPIEHALQPELIFAERICRL